jgi:hypothetical protein
LRKYLEDVRLYCKQVFRGEVIHVFRNGTSSVTSELRKPAKETMRRQYWKHRLLRSRVLRTTPYSLFAKLRTKAWRVFSSGTEKQSVPDNPGQ